MPVKPEDDESKETPRTDLPPAREPREPYYEGYFGTDEEEGVERETEADPGKQRPRSDPEESAGGDREI